MGWGYDPINIWTLNGLKNSYTTKDAIKLTVMFKGRAFPCFQIPVVSLKDSADNTVWQSKQGLALCPAVTANSIIYLEKEWIFGTAAPSKTGMYSISVVYPSDISLFQKNFTVSNP